MRVEQSQVVRAPREQVFEAWTDYDAWPDVSPLFTRVTLLERAGNTARVKMQTRFMGLRMPRTEKHVLTPPDRIEVIGDVPMATNTTVWKFEAVPEGTMLTAVLVAEFKGVLKLLQPVAERQARSVLGEWMRAFARYVEAK